MVLYKVLRGATENHDGWMDGWAKERTEDFVVNACGVCDWVGWG